MTSGRYRGFGHGLVSASIPSCAHAFGVVQRFGSGMRSAASEPSSALRSQYSPGPNCYAVAPTALPGATGALTSAPEWYETGVPSLYRPLAIVGRAGIC